MQFFTLIQLMSKLIAEDESEAQSNTQLNYFDPDMLSPKSLMLVQSLVHVSNNVPSAHQFDTYVYPQSLRPKLI